MYCVVKCYVVTDPPCMADTLLGSHVVTPAVGVGDSGILDVTNGLVESLADFAGLIAVLVDYAIVGVDDARDR